MAFVGFNANHIQPMAPRPPRELLPRGTQLVAACTASESKTSVAGNEYLLYTFADEQGRSWPYRIMMTGSQKAREIGQMQHSQLCSAAGIVELADSSQLHGIPVVLVLGVEEANGEWPAKNKIAYINPANDGVIAHSVVKNNEIIDDDLPF